MFKNFFFFENPAVYEIMWKNIAGSGRPQMIIWRTRIVCWIPKATNTQSAYVIVIDLPPQHLWYKRAPMLRYKHIACCAKVVNTFYLLTYSLLLIAPVVSHRHFTAKA
jgi:hypothetical protein